MKTLQLMHSIAKTHEDFTHPHAIGILNNFRGFTKSSLKKMEEKEWIQIVGNQWKLTETGFKEANDMFHANTIEHE